MKKKKCDHLDDLKLIDDIKIPKYRRGAVFLSVIHYFSKAFKESGVWTYLFLGACFGVSLGVYRSLDVLLGTHMNVFTFLCVLQIVTAGFCFLSFCIARKISLTYNSRLNTGFRDSWFLTAPLSLNLLNILSSAFSKGMFFVLILFGLSLAGIIFFCLFYIFKIGKKKQPDLDVPYLIDADPLIDAKAEERLNRKKVQINGDTRDTFLLKTGEEISITLNRECKRIKFAVAVRETSDVEAAKDILIDVWALCEAGKEKIFSKVMSQKSVNNAYLWSDCEAEIPEVLGQIKTIQVKTTKEQCGDNVRPGSEICCFSGPRLSLDEKRKNKIVLIVMDAVRSDHIGAYGYDRKTTPNIDAFAAENSIFKNSMVQGEWTLPSFMSILTGMYPSSHHVYHESQYNSLAEHIPTLPGVLRSNGFITRSYFTHKRLMSHFGFAKGFDSHIFRQCDKRWNVATADDVTDRAIDMMEYHKNDDLFLIAHYFDTHQPCDPPSPFSEMLDKTYGKIPIRNIRMQMLKNKGLKPEKRDIDNLLARYDSEIFRVDMKIGMIINYLKSTGQYDDAMIIITSDHGMLLGDHGSLAKISLFDETVKVPLLIKFPDKIEKNSNVIADMVEANIDLMPTILDSFGMHCPENVQGRSVLPLLKGTTSDRKGFAVSELLFGNKYTASIRDNKKRFNYKTEFDLTNFTNFDRVRVEETFFNVKEGAAEVPVETSQDMSYRDLYMGRIDEHIKNSLDFLKNE